MQGDDSEPVGNVVWSQSPGPHEIQLGFDQWINQAFERDFECAPHKHLGGLLWRQQFGLEPERCECARVAFPARVDHEGGSRFLVEEQRNDIALVWNPLGGVKCEALAAACERDVDAAALGLVPQEGPRLGWTARLYPDDRNRWAERGPRDEPKVGLAIVADRNNRDPGKRGRWSVHASAETGKQRERAHKPEHRASS